jgi:RNA polymerase sigma factor (sigma-70 family)
MATRETDITLLRRFRDRGDEQAFAEIVRRHAAVVFGTCRRILANSALAEDATQETFFRLVQRRDEVNESVGGWLVRVATTLAIDAARSESSRRRRETARRAQAPPTEATQWADVSPVVDEALAELPSDTRALLVERFLRGRSQTEMAEERGTSQATLSRQINNGLEQLRRLLRDKGVVVAAIAPLACWMREQACCGQVPASLMRELGKMSLVSRNGAISASSRLIAKCIATAKGALAVSNDMALLIIVAILGILIGWSKGDFLNQRDDDNPVEHRLEEASRQRRPATRFDARGFFHISAAGRQSADADDTVVAFKPAGADDGALQVMFADRRVENMPRSEADDLVFQQTGLTLNQWLWQHRSASSKSSAETP